MEAKSFKSYGSGRRTPNFKTRDRIGVYEALATPLSAVNFGRVKPRQVMTGRYRGEQQIGDENIKIESSERRILVSDGDNDRILLGFDEDGF